MRQKRQGRVRRTGRTVLKNGGDTVRATLLSSLALFLALCVRRTSAHSQALNWRQLLPLPDALGFAGAFVGVSEGAFWWRAALIFPIRCRGRVGKRSGTIQSLFCPGRTVNGRVDSSCLGLWLTVFRLPLKLVLCALAAATRGNIFAKSSGCLGLETGFKPSRFRLCPGPWRTVAGRCWGKRFFSLVGRKRPRRRMQ